MRKFEVVEYWSDNCTFPEIRDRYEIEAKNMSDAVKQILATIKPQIRRFIDVDMTYEDMALLTYYPQPSKNKTDYTETIEIRQEE